MLVEDTETEVERFKQAGGIAIKYSGDEDFVGVLELLRFEGKTPLARQIEKARAKRNGDLDTHRMGGYVWKRSMSKETR